MDLTCIADPVIYAPHLARLAQGCVDAREVLEQAIRHRRPIEIYRDRDFMHLSGPASLTTGLTSLVQSTINGRTHQAIKPHFAEPSFPDRHRARASIAWFLIIAFALSWSIWVPEALAEWHVLPRHVPRLLYLFAQFSPAVAAVVVTGLTGGANAVKVLVKRVARVRLSMWWYLVVALFPAGTLLVAAAVDQMVSGPATGAPTWSDLPILIPLGTVLSLGEEIGWRGFLLPTLMRHHSALAASAIIAVFWGLWHAPAILPQTGGTAFYLVYLSGMFPVAALFTWTFLQTRSVLLCAIFHASIDAAVSCYGARFSPEHLLFVSLWMAVLWIASIPVLLAMQRGRV